MCKKCHPGSHYDGTLESLNHDPEYQHGFRIFSLFIIIGSIILLFTVVSENDKLLYNKTTEDCYRQVGRNNITYEYLEDGYYHAESNGILVCAHGAVNPNGLKETIPFPYIFGIKVVDINDTQKT